MKLQPRHLQSFWNKKNILFVSLVLVVAIGIGVTTAWLSGYDDPILYKFEGAFVDCRVDEQFNGTTKSNVRVQNTGNVDAYLRATYTVNWVKDGTGVNNVIPVVHYEQPQLGTDYAITYGAGWVMSSDGYVYYNSAVSPNEFTKNFIKTLTDKGTAPAGYHLQVTVIPEAVQAQGAGTTAFDKAWGATKDLAQVRPVANEESKSLETMVLTMNIRNSGDQYGYGTFAADTGSGEWTQRRASVAQYLRGSERDIICLQDVSTYQRDWLEANVNNADSKLTYGFAYWSFQASQQWYRGLLTMYDTNRYEYIGYELVPFSESGSDSDLTYVDNTLADQPYHYRGALITRFKEKSSGVVIAVCNVQADYPADNMVGQHTSTKEEKVDELREMGVRRALARLYAQDADFYMMAGDFTADAYRNPTWYNTIASKMKDVLPGETTKTINNWEEKYTMTYQREGPKPGDVNGPVDFIFVDKNTEVFSDDLYTSVREDSFNYGADLYSHHYAVVSKLKFKNH